MFTIKCKYDINQTIWEVDRAKEVVKECIVVGLRINEKRELRVLTCVKGSFKNQMWCPQDYGDWFVSKKKAEKELNDWKKTLRYDSVEFVLKGKE